MSADGQQYDPPQIMATHQDTNGDLTSILFHVTRQSGAAGATDRLILEWPQDGPQHWRLRGPDGAWRRVIGVTLHTEEE